jgi:aubergine-like protein
LVGTIIEEAVSNELNEFYLIPITCSLSTVRPVRYIVLHNDNTMPLVEFQSLTYGLCHVYPNWPDSITLPFPTQLAHKLAFLIGDSLQSSVVHKNLQSNYYYL